MRKVSILGPIGVACVASPWTRFGTNVKGDHPRKMPTRGRRVPRICFGCGDLSLVAVCVRADRASTCLWSSSRGSHRRAAARGLLPRLHRLRDWPAPSAFALPTTALLVALLSFTPKPRLNFALSRALLAACSGILITQIWRPFLQKFFFLFWPSIQFLYIIFKFLRFMQITVFFNLSYHNFFYLTLTGQFAGLRGLYYSSDKFWNK